jgi:hypothetical protein
MIKNLILIPLFLLLIASCSKEPKEGSAVIWYGEYTALNLDADGAYSLTYTVGGEIIGSTATSTYYTASPNCGSNGSITYTNEPGSYSYTVKDQTDFIYWTGTIIITEEGCYALELTF